MTTRALYAGSFDPPTLGHLDVIRRGARVFDEVVVAVGHNPAKRTWFDVDERCRLVRAAVAEMRGVSVVPFEGLLVDACAEHGATVILRGLRPLGDFDSEFRYGLANRDLSGIETVFLLSDPAHAFLSSSLVKEIASHGGDVAKYVPPAVLDAIRRHLS